MTAPIPFVLDTIVNTGFTFCQINNSRIAAGIETDTHFAVGHVDPMYRTTKMQRAMVEFSTPQLKTLLSASLANCGGRGVAGTSVLTHYLKKKTTTGNVARATAEHKKLAINSWHMHWSKITLPHRGTAEASVTINAVYDSTNYPIVYTNNVALVGNLTAAEQFGCGKVSINGTALSDLIESIEIDSGVKLMQLSGQDSVWDGFCATQETDPVVTIKFLEPLNWSTLGLTGLELNGSTGLEFYARRKGPLGPVANATASHIYFIGANGRCVPVDTNGQRASETTDTLRVELVAPSDSVLPLLGTVDSAIT